MLYAYTHTRRQWRNASMPMMGHIRRMQDVEVYTPEEAADPLAAMHHLATQVSCQQPHASDRG